MYYYMYYTTCCTSALKANNELFDSPSVILSIKKEISAHNSDTHSYDGENHEHKEHKTKHIVDLVRPEGCEDEIPVVNKEIRKV